MKVHVLVAALLAPAALGQSIRVEQITPHATDAAITQWNPAHVAMLDTSRAARPVLFLYLHGQGGSGGGAQELLRVAAGEGLFTVGLTYPNDWTPFTYCNGSNSDCYENLRREILDGVDRSPFISVDQTNCVEHRLLRLVQFLASEHPAEGWGQFLSGDSIRWGSVLVWGHSQGGANAAVLARNAEVLGACLTAPATDFVGNQPAAWWSSHATPTQRYAGFCHAQDQLSAKLAAWHSIGMDAFGAVRDVAGATSPFGLVHELSTSVAPAVAGQYHNSVDQDSVTPRGPDGTPVYAPVWRYMIRRVLGELCSADFNGDGDMGTDVDIEAFFACLAGSCCDTCGLADFNGDGDTGTDTDIESFFRVLAGGAC
jgi:pimeloyl-ACP methyl ester carboxylesterase